jgi:hypothetical protein
MSKRFKVEFVGIEDQPFWFDTHEEVDEFIRFTKGCYVEDVPGNQVQLKVTEYNVVKMEVI